MAIANTNSLSTNFNVSPYYDDYNEAKNFHRILFRPGLAVQARELTQMQSIQQNQIDRFAEHIFEEGSTVRGLEMNYDQNVPFVRVRDNDQNVASVNVYSFIGSTLTGETSGVTAYVVDAVSGAAANYPDTKTLYIRYTGSGSLGTTPAFLSAEVITSNTASLSANVVTANSSILATGTGSRITFGAGVIYAKDNFIRVDAANTIIGKYNANTTLKIGFNINETIITSASDTTLLDPAQGSYNYAAPGSDRFKNGTPEFKADKPTYSVINDYIARRTYDESGNYIVNGLTSRTREHLNSANNGGVYTSSQGGDVNKLSIDMSPGKAYVKGFEVENIITNHVTIDKGTDVNSPENISIPANYGNYVEVDELVGTWDINGQDKIDLYNAPINAISNNSFTAILPASRGTKIGEARVRALQYNNGTKGDSAGKYNMYLYDINMTANNFSYVRSVFYNDGTTDGIADTVLTANTATVKETKFNRSIFNIPAANIKTLRDSAGNIDNEFRFIREFPITISSAGQVTITTSSDEQYPFTTGPLNNTQERDNFTIILEAAANTATTLETTAARAAGANTITGLTSATSKYNIGDVLKLQGEANTYVVSSIVGATSVRVHGNGEGAAISGATLFKNFKQGQVISLNGVGGDAAARAVTINSATSATIDIQETLNSTVAASAIIELKKVDGREKAKVINENRLVQVNVTGSGTTTGPWNLGISDGFKLREVRFKTGNTVFTTLTEGTDVTDQFDLDTGMKDNYYDHSKLKLKQSASHAPANGNVYLVKFDYFTHDTSQGVGYFSVDSYPIDDVNGSANTNAITTAEIPVYTSPTTGTRYDLRDQIDIRPLIANTCAPTTSLPSPATPATSTSIVEPSGGLRFMAPNETFTTDFDYYLPRKDRIVITSTGTFRVVKGVPDLNPQTPQGPSDGMTLAIVNVKPYPSLPQENAKRIRTATAPAGRGDLSIKVAPVRIRRFTMKDIHGLEQRIDNLEYYTSLSLLESDTKTLFLADSTGADRFKNGIIVDQFVDFTSSDFYDEGYKIALDKIKKEIRPSFKVDDVQINFISAESTNVSVSSKDTTVTITSTTAIYTVGETVTQGAASGKLVYQVGTRLYLDQVVGTFDTTANVVGGTSSSTSAVSAVSKSGDGKLIMLPWTHDATIDQPFATDTRNAAGLNYNFKGVLTLNPNTDYWNDTVVAPSVTVDFGFIAEGFQEIANWLGTEWNDWGTTQAEQRGNQIFTDQERTGRLLNVEPAGEQETNLGDSVQSVSLIPFMRSRVVEFTAEGLKPSTRVYAFFDGTDVNNYVAPANTSFANTASEGGALISSADGVLYGIFRVPNDDQLRFPVGNLKLRITDSPTNSSSLGAATTVAETNYSAGGLDVSTQGTIIATREVDVSIRTLVEERTLITAVPRRGGVDPLAQTFRVSDGIDSNIPGAFLTKIDLFFASKDETQPVVIEIRETDPSTAYVTSRVVPFSRTIIPAADINVSSTSASPTPIIFETPVYLLNDVDYAILIMPADGNPNVTMWTARLGANDLITGNRITTQPAAGILFASANDKSWTPIQEEDIKFKMYFANFRTNQTGSAIFKNIDKEYLTIDTKDTSDLFNRVGEQVNGETTLTLSAAPGGIAAGDSLVGGTSSANGTVTNVSGNAIRLKEVTTASKFTNTETVTLYKAGIVGSNTATVSSQATSTGNVYFFDALTQANTMVHLSASSGSFVANTYIRGQISGLDARVASIDNLPIDTFQAFVSKLELQDTTATLTAKLATSDSALDTTFRKANINTNTEYDTRRYVLSRSNEVSNLSSAKSAQFTATLTNGANIRHSPAIDNDRAAVFTVENLINNDDTNENTAGNGNAIARYVQRTVTLADGQDAEDLKVFITAYKPSTADVKLYVKLLNGEDGDSIEDRPWLELSQLTATSVVSDSEDRDDYREFEYGVPTTSLTGPSDEVQYTASSGVTYTGFKYFKIKAVLLSTSSSIVPRVTDFRAIALQI